MNRGFYAAVAAGVIVPLVFVGHLFFAPASGEEEQAVCLVLIDRTGSSTDDRTEQSYESLARRAVDGCREHNAALALYYFDNTSPKLVPASSDQPFMLYRPRTHRKSVGEEAVREAQRSADAAIEKVFASKPAAGGHGSDIVTAMDLAAENLQQLAARGRVQQKYLVVLTDGYQTGEELGLRRAIHQGLTRQRVVARVADLGLVPQLDGVKTTFAGVNGGMASANSSLAEEAYLRTFWQELVTSGGGELCVYNLDPMLLPGMC